MRVLVTGGTGFVARHLAEYLVRHDGYQVRLATRNPDRLLDGSGIEVVRGPELEAESDWSGVLADVDVVVHTAGRAHVFDKSSNADAQREFDAVNVEGSSALAEQAVAAGVNRFVFISSIGVFGSTRQEKLTEDSEPHPSEPYAVSKLRAEKVLQGICRDASMSLLIVRPPMVYGRDAPGNFFRLVKLVDRGWPLPLANATSPRSFIGIDNLCQFLSVCACRHECSDDLFLVSDDEDISTAELVRQIGAMREQAVRLFPVPRTMMKVGSVLLGQDKVYRSLFEPLQVDCGHARRELSWAPALSVREGLKEALLIEKECNREP